MAVSAEKNGASSSVFNAPRARPASQHKPHKVIHLAAKVGGLFANMKEKVEFYRENIMMNDNVMECCRVHGVDKVRVSLCVTTWD